MNSTKSIDEVSFCVAVKYTSDKDYYYDYSASPRPCHNFVFMLEGEATFVTQSSTLQVRKGDILFIPQNSTYTSQWKATPACVYHSVHFRFSLGKDPFKDKRIPVQLMPNDQFEKLYETVKTFDKYRYSKDLDAFLYLSAFYSLCGLLLPKAKVNDAVLPESRIMPAVIYLENNFTKECKIEYLASLCFLSPSRFFYLFKKNVGCSPIAYKNKIAIQKASQALVLRKDKSIENIAFEYGFESPVYFRRLFKKLTGKTPSKYRKEAQLI